MSSSGTSEEAPGPPPAEPARAPAEGAAPRSSASPPRGPPPELGGPAPESSDEGAEDTIESTQDMQRRIEAGDSTVVPILLRKLRASQDKLMIRLLIRVASQLAAQDHLRILSKLYRHPDTHVRLWVLAAIARLEDHEYYPLILHGYFFDESRRVRSACRRTLRRLSPSQLKALVGSMAAHSAPWMQEVAEEAARQLLSRETSDYQVPERAGTSSQELMIESLDGIDLGPKEEGFCAPDDDLVVSTMGQPRGEGEEGDAEEGEDEDPRSKRMGIAEAIAQQDREARDRTFSRRDCPKCGERIMVEALLCRYCQEVFEPEELEKVEELAKVKVVPLPVRSPSHRGSALVIDILLAGLLLPLGGLGLLYFLAKDSLGQGQSFGKRAYNLKVVDAESGEACTLRQSLVRNAWLLVPFLPMVGVVTLSATGLRWGDKMGETRVVFEDDPPATALLASASLLMLSLFSLAVVLVLHLAPKSNTGGW